MQIGEERSKENDEEISLAQSPEERVMAVEMKSMRDVNS